MIEGEIYIKRSILYYVLYILRTVYKYIYNKQMAYQYLTTHKWKMRLYTIFKSLNSKIKIKTFIFSASFLNDSLDGLCKKTIC